MTFLQSTVPMIVISYRKVSEMNDVEHDGLFYVRDDEDDHLSAMVSGWFNDVSDILTLIINLPPPSLRMTLLVTVTMIPSLFHLHLNLQVLWKHQIKAFCVYLVWFSNTFIFMWPNCTFHLVLLILQGREFYLLHI